MNRFAASSLLSPLQGFVLPPISVRETETAESEGTVTPQQSPRPSAMPPIEAIPDISDSYSRSIRQPMSLNSMHASTIRQTARPVTPSTMDPAPSPSITPKKSKLASLASNRSIPRTESLASTSAESTSMKTLRSVPLSSSSSLKSLSTAPLPRRTETRSLRRHDEHERERPARQPKAPPLQSTPSPESIVARPQAPTPAMAQRGRDLASTTNSDSPTLSTLGNVISQPQKPASKLALLAQTKAANAYPKAKQPKVMGPPLVRTKYLTPTSNTSVMTTAITTYMQTPDTMLALSTLALPPSYPPSQSSTGAKPTAGLTKLASKAKKGHQSRTVVEPSAETAPPRVVDPIYRSNGKGYRASPSAFASVLLDKEQLIEGATIQRPVSTTKHNRRRSGDRKSQIISHQTFKSSRHAAEFDKPSPDDIVLNARHGTSLGDRHSKQTTRNPTTGRSGALPPKA